MPKHARKRQKTDATTRGDPIILLGHPAFIDDDAQKDDEERRLESVLFGKPFKGSNSKTASNLPVDFDVTLESPVLDDRGKALENLLDSDLFFVDDGLGGDGESSTRPDAFADMGLVSSDGSDDDEHETQDTPHQPEDEGSRSDADSDPEPEPSSPTPALSKNLRIRGKAKGPVWTDPDDSTLAVSLASNSRLRKLRDAPGDDVVLGRDYEMRLRRQFEKINPAPEWAAKVRDKKAKRRREAGSGDEESEEENLPALLSSTGGILSQDKARSIPAGQLAVERLRDANQGAKSEGAVKSIQFHPLPKVPVLLTAGADRRLRLFNIDGHTNPHIQTLHIPELPLTTALFHPTGSSILLTGPRPFYYTYDLHSGATHRSPRGLWGTTFGDANPSTQDSSMEICAFSPGDGNVLAVGGRRGYVHLVDWRSGGGSGGAQVVASVKMNAGVKSVGWAQSIGGGTELMTLAEDSEVYVWDVGTRRCVRRWKDGGGFGSTVMASGPGSKYLGVGSTSGYVNVYGSDALGSGSSAAVGMPKPLKEFGNLTTGISSLAFNHDAQLLAIASKVKKDQLRLLHLKSMTAFSNWPTSSTPLGHVTSVAFSSTSAYLAIGNTRGRVLLYNLKHFGARS